MVQEAWLRLVRYEDERAPIEQPEAFLMRTALNLSIDAHRSTVSHGEHVVLEHAVLIDTAPSAEDFVLARERTARLEEGLRRLTDKTRDIFLAHRLDGLTYKEIAALEGISSPRSICTLPRPHCDSRAGWKVGSRANAGCARHAAGAGRAAARDPGSRFRGRHVVGAPARSQPIPFNGTRVLGVASAVCGASTGV